MPARTADCLGRLLAGWRKTMHTPAMYTQNANLAGWHVSSIKAKSVSNKRCSSILPLQNIAQRLVALHHQIPGILRQCHLTLQFDLYIAVPGQRSQAGDAKNTVSCPFNCVI